MYFVRSLLTVLIFTFLASGCTVYTAQPAAPPVRMEVRPSPPYTTAVWMAGHWKWSRWHHQYVWVPGHWVVKKHPRW